MEHKEESKNFTADTLYPLFMHCAHIIGRGHHRCPAMHPSQHRVLSLLAGKDFMTQQELLEVLDIRASSLSELLSKLEDKELISRTKPDPSKRNVNVEITDLGAAVAEEYAQHKEAAAQALFGSLSEEEQETLAGLLHKLFQDWHGKLQAEAEGEEGHHCHHHEGHCHGEGHGCGCHGEGEHHHHHGCPHRRDEE